MSRKLLFVLATAAVAASAAAAAVGVHWTVLEIGMTDSGDSSTVQGYVAVTKAQEARFVQRLDPAGRAAVARLNLQNTGIVAVFLGGMPCARKITVNGVSRTASTVTVMLHWTPPPVGMAMCVRLGTPYALVGVSRATLGRPAPTRVRVLAVARS